MKFELHWSHGMLSGNGEMSIMGLGDPAFFLELLRKSQTFQASRVWAPQSLPPRSHLGGGVMRLDVNWAEATKPPLSQR